MWSIYFRVNNQGQYKNYMDGTYVEMKKASDDLEARASKKGFKFIQRASGLGGVYITYSNGTTKVEIVYTDSNRDRQWLNNCQ